MCSYAALTNPALSSDSASHPHSEPCCASKFFAVTKMVEEYGFEGYVQSDCGAVNNELHGEHYAVNTSDAAAKAIVDGRMNSNCGNGALSTPHARAHTRTHMCVPPPPVSCFHHLSIQCVSVPSRTATPSQTDYYYFLLSCFLPVFSFCG